MSKEWHDYSMNFNMKIADDFVDGLEGKEDLMTNGGVFLRETEHEHEFEFVAVSVHEGNVPAVSHGYVNLDDYRGDVEFNYYAEEENMTVDELIDTGTFAASWILENDVSYIIGMADKNVDVSQFIDDMKLFDSPEQMKAERI